MSGERRPSPDWQVRKTLELLRSDGMGFEEAWYLAVHGQVCDSYRSARGTTPPPPVERLPSPPPDLRPSAGPKRCCGCRFADDIATGGPARCTLYAVDVQAGVAWPHRTDDRERAKAAISASRDEWRRAYSGQRTPVSAIFDALSLRS